MTCVPQRERCIDEEVELFGGNEKQIARLKKTIGLDRRRVVDDSTTAADLCEAAARRLLPACDLESSDIDAVICVTQTPDYPQPCNAAVLHGKLGLPKNCAALDVNLGCSGYVYGLWLAFMMISSGGCKRVLLLAGDTISRLVNKRDRSVASLFGDGGSATMIEQSDGAGTSWMSMDTDGTGFDRLIVPAGGARHPHSAETHLEAEDDAGNLRSKENLFMDGAEVFNFSISEEPKAVSDLLDFAGIEIDDVDHFVFHQANRYILSNIAKRLEIDPAKVPMRTVERFGNQSSASIPSALCSELGDLLSLDAGRQVLLSGFGVGLSWATALLPISSLRVCEVIDYKA